jgi:hypothetical protein
MSTSPIRNHRTCYRAVAIAAVFAVAMALSSSPGAAAASTEHNARVAEYLLQHRTSEHRNARVAEYLQLRRSGTDISGLHSSR